jgi:ProP effector
VLTFAPLALILFHHDHRTTLEKAIDPRALLKDLQARFEVFRSFSPLAIGIDKQVFAQLPDVSKKALRLAMRSHTISTRYLKEMEKGTIRRNLDGTRRAT